MLKRTIREQPANLEILNINAGYQGHLVLRDITFTVPCGEEVAIVGPNGAGKSTLFKILAGLLQPHSGAILIHGRPFQYFKDSVAYIPQREEVDWRFPVTVRDVVAMGRFGKLRWMQRPEKKDLEIVDEKMQVLGIYDLGGRSIGELSGGQQQRVFLARALVQEPHILLLDEPFSGIDVTTQETTLELLSVLKKQHVTVMVSTHDLNLAAQRFDKVLLINHKVIAFGQPREVFSVNNIRSAFGEQILLVGDGLVVDQCCSPENGKIEAL